MESISPISHELESSSSSKEVEPLQDWAFMAQIAKQLLLSPTQLKPNFHSFDSTHHVEYALKKENLHFFQFHASDGDFYDNLLSKISKGDSKLSQETNQRLIVRQSVPILIPNDDALQCLIFKDVDKYSIPILFSSVTYFTLQLKLFKKELNDQPCYCGIMVVENDPNYQNNIFHAVSLLCYFGPKIEGEERKEECLVFGSFGDRPHLSQECELFSTVTRELKNREISYLKIQRMEKFVELRRTYSRIFLRNVLLDLKFRGEKRSFSEILANYRKPFSNQLLTIPQEWKYAEELSNITDASSKIIRDYFSHKPQKRENPRTLKEFRDGKHIPVENDCSWILSPDFFKKVTSGMKHIPHGAKGKSTFTVEHTNKTTTYGYLVHKSWKDWESVHELTAARKSPLTAKPKFVKPREGYCVV